MAYQKMPDFMGQPANAVRRLSDGTIIPMADDNADYARYLEWVAAGNEPADVDAPDPETVRAGMACSRLQGRLVLGPDTCAQLDAIAASPDTPWAMRETIQNAMEWRRTSEAMTELGYLLGYNDDQMDALFVQAMGVSV